jgi:putative transcriptional regulator
MPAPASTLTRVSSPFMTSRWSTLRDCRGRGAVTGPPVRDRSNTRERKTLTFNNKVITINVISVVANSCQRCAEHDFEMSIRINLDMELARKKMSLTELSQRVGVSMTNLSLLKTGKVKAIRFSTLEAICQALDCQPGDLLEHVLDQSQGDQR